MIKFKKKFYLFKLTDNYFHAVSTMSNFWSIRKYSFLPVNHPTPLGCIKTDFHTVILDLKLAEDEIIADFSGTVRKNVRKAEKLGMVADFNQDLKSFLGFYNTFAKSKGIYPVPESLIDELKSNFKICWVRYEGEILSAGLSLYDERLGIAYDYLAGSRRLDERFDRATVGLAGKLMKKEEIMHFKKMGMSKYDFGGYAWETTDKSLMGINEFKLSFGGSVMKLANFKSIPYFILIKMARLLDRRYR
jgi:lipid II:glycine glycyltransferase (peptidoglycan interpeptide bridge formation enzyme)